jgi:hypothetical protein
LFGFSFYCYNSIALHWVTVLTGSKF